MTTERLFEIALGVEPPWFVREVSFDVNAKVLTIGVDFKTGSRFHFPGSHGEHPVHDMATKRYPHLNCFEHECFLEVSVPGVRLPDASVRLIESP